eukprot:1670320-Prymnesium_polylepis.1
MSGVRPSTHANPHSQPSPLHYLDTLWRVQREGRVCERAQRGNECAVGRVCSIYWGRRSAVRRAAVSRHHTRPRDGKRRRAADAR